MYASIWESVNYAIEPQFPYFPLAHVLMISFYSAIYSAIYYAKMWQNKMIVIDLQLFDFVLFCHFFRHLFRQNLAE
jgi:hypothetical protein